MDMGAAAACDLPLTFVAGLHRSGTSAVTKLLASHPRVHGMTATGVPEDEGQHVQTCYPTAEESGGPGLFAFDPGAHLTEESSLAASIDPAVLLSEWAPYWDVGVAGRHRPAATSADLLVEKSPPNLVRGRFLQHLFPQARFVVVVRHPAVVSMSTARWRPRLATATLLRHWAYAHALYAQDAPHLRRVLQVRYEDLLADPAAWARRLAAFLGVPDEFDTGVLERGRSISHLAAWEQLCRRWDRDTLGIVQPQLQRWGYVLEPPYVLGRARPTG